MSGGSTGDDIEGADGLPYGDEKSRVYRAAGGSKRCMLLMLVPGEGDHDRQYPFSDIRMTELRKDGTEYLIEFSHITVIATGRNLRTVAFAVGAHTCSRLEAFDARNRDMPKDTDPFITRIAFYTQKDGDDAEAAKAGKH